MMLTLPDEITPDARPDPDMPAEAAAEWTELVESIRAGSQDAMSRLYSTFGKGVRYYLSRQLGAQEIEDKVHDTFLVVLGAIQRGNFGSRSG